MDNVRLIDANKAEEYLYDHLDDLHLVAAMNAINEMPTIDAQPVKSGKWECQENMPFESCSICRYRNYDPVYTPNFCPNCGADMRGDKDGRYI